MNRRTAVMGSVVAVILGALWILWPRPTARTAGPLPHDAYIWQRVWNEPVRDAIATHGTNFSELVALVAEVAWRRGTPQVVRVPIDFAALRASGRRAGIALRIGSLAGPFSADDERARLLRRVAASLIQEATTHHLAVAELQIDFDCAESTLDGYRLWVEAIRHDVTPVPVTITALPSWLKHPALARLVAAADGFVLQVHSLERPRSAEAPFTLCDRDAARLAVEQAARLGRPFRVALPTYGYRIAFDAKGKFAGLNAEGPDTVWPAGCTVQELRADPNAMAALVQGWTTNRPPTLHGVIWYRLPVEGESLNWRWPTLASVMAGQAPHAATRVEARRPQPGLVELDLVNDGNAASSAAVQVTLRWAGARLLAADALRGFDITHSGTNSVQFLSKPRSGKGTAGSGTGASVNYPVRARPGPEPDARLEPSERRCLGWIRLNTNAEVKVEIAFSQN